MSDMYSQDAVVEFEFEWRFYALSASEAIFRARTYKCITGSFICPVA